MGLLECVFPGRLLIRAVLGRDKALPTGRWPPSDPQHTTPSISLSVCWHFCLSVGDLVSNDLNLLIFVTLPFGL